MNAPSWDLSKLRRHVRQMPEAAHLLTLIRSIDRSVRIFIYHMVTARDAMDGILSEKNHEHDLMFVLGGTEKQEEFERASIVSEANLVGCFYATRSMLDAFSQLVNALVLGSQVSIEICDLKKVTAALPSSALRDQLSELLSSSWFLYVSDFTNTSKHRHLVPHVMLVSFEEERSGMQVGAFAYGKRKHPTYWMRDALAGVLEVKNKIVGLGCSLNMACIHE